MIAVSFDQNDIVDLNADIASSADFWLSVVWQFLDPVSGGFDASHIQVNEYLGCTLAVEPETKEHGVRLLFTDPENAMRIYPFAFGDFVILSGHFTQTIDDDFACDQIRLWINAEQKFSDEYPVENVPRLTRVYGASEDVTMNELSIDWPPNQEVSADSWRGCIS